MKQTHYIFNLILIVVLVLLLSSFQQEYNSKNIKSINTKDNFQNKRKTPGLIRTRHWGYYNDNINYPKYSNKSINTLYAKDEVAIYIWHFLRIKQLIL